MVVVVVVASSGGGRRWSKVMRVRFLLLGLLETLNSLRVEKAVSKYSSSKDSSSLQAMMMK